MAFNYCLIAFVALLFSLAAQGDHYLRMPPGPALPHCLSGRLVRPVVAAPWPVVVPSAPIAPSVLRQHRVKQSGQRDAVARGQAMAACWIPPSCGVLRRRHRHRPGVYRCDTRPVVGGCGTTVVY
ncbi:hypothetical protein EVAR_100965_1 [Eumeta japonica]|uniref:Secreted protein n=1 Tax=Eumeta variegata TaxID=151549 RepID=A0A4C2AD52_EUMVA|nr:hypothetical protein EVAR_100965_1 [Eumeta japonica]